MRTTLELPDDLARRAKMDAVRRGVSLKQVVAEALEKQLDSGSPKTTTGSIEYPLIRSRKKSMMKLSPKQIDEILLREEVASYEATKRR